MTILILLYIFVNLTHFTKVYYECPVISRMHGLGADPLSTWSIQGQAEFTDVLTTHPFPFWCSHTRNDEIRLSFGAVA